MQINDNTQQKNLRPKNSGSGQHTMDSSLAFASDSPQMKPEIISEMNLDSEGAPERITDDMIADRAYEIWEQAGKPEGVELINWRQAEQELKALSH